MVKLMKNNKIKVNCMIEGNFFEDCISLDQCIAGVNSGQWNDLWQQLLHYLWQFYMEHLHTLGLVRSNE